LDLPTKQQGPRANWFKNLLKNGNVTAVQGSKIMEKIKIKKVK
jgi:hypothetical protein